MRKIEQLENELISLRIYHGRRNRMSRKPWIYKHCGKWYCRTNAGTLLRPLLIQGIGDTPRNAWLAWDEIDSPLS